ncbi:helicase-related protein [Geopseudomonas guangdongensis]|uniref:SNF2 family N-terminal domain-containing protein n=1 Tax=Geopseudomonas guangdongensis TaxID=1245526 RepID=A0A1H2IB09_9GAMM|nr:helicase-related protein [Pseudomonas guangdongensis]SDU41283.1 SNF2 family N-terminal domain-containing protein [Pseudomonas guangdongensis]
MVGRLVDALRINSKEEIGKLIMSTSLADYPWRYSYKTSSLTKDGHTVDILREFYIPLLQRAVRYDRVAGYFRSSSLALASRGFSTFVSRDGKVRLIAGADLHPQDVQAIINGQGKLDDALQEALDNPAQWREAELRGVELLSWMVRQGYLEIRVALRVHSQTGQAISLDSGVDGYVHEKWALAYDAEGNCLYASGSWNESQTALAHNAENVDVDCSWQGSKEQAKIADAQRDFEALWNDQHPAFKVVDLPTAVKERLISFSEQIQFPVEMDGKPALLERPTLSPLEQARFQLIKYAPLMPNGQYVGLYTAPVQPWPHQIVVAHRLIDNYPASGLMCDEVGLGKTIEAGLVFRALYLSERAKRILIAAPASLTQQWQREMASKFLLPFRRVRSGPSLQLDYLLPQEGSAPASGLYDADLSIISTGLMTRQERRQALKSAQQFDLVLLDESHYARRSNSQRGVRGYPQYNNLYKTLQDLIRPATKSLLLATATPMQLDPVEVSDLIALTNRVGAFKYDPSLTLRYYQLTAALSQGQALEREEWALLRAAVTSIEHLDPVLWRYLLEVVIDPFSKIDLEQWLKSGVVPQSINHPALARLLFAAAPLSRVMQRHTRDLLKIYRNKGKLKAGLAKRQVITPPRIVFTPQEARVESFLHEYCEGLREAMLNNGECKPNQTALGFYLSFLRLRFASSLRALKLTVQRRLDRVQATLIQQLSESTSAEDRAELEDLLLEGGEDDLEAVDSLLRNRTPEDLRWERDCLQALRQEVEDLSQVSSKMQVLLMVLGRRKQPSGRIQQTVIFTRFFDTLEDIVERIQAVHPHARIGTYSGQGGSYFDVDLLSMVGCEREKIKHRFVQGEIDILVCTDAAAEGLNLQTADMLINFDLPWNPMKVEQRIGRIDRIGQRHSEISVLNLCYADSAEQFVYERLMQRLEKAGLVVGTQQFSLLPVTVDEFEQLAAKTLDEQQLEKIALERARQQREHNKLLEIPAQELFDIYTRLEMQYRSLPLPVTLAQIWRSLIESEYLKSCGCQFSPCARYITLNGVDPLIDGSNLTVDRELMDVGLPGEEPLHFASYGDPVFDHLLTHLTALAEAGGAVQVILAESDGIRQAAIAFCDTESGASRLAQKFDELESHGVSGDVVPDATLNGYAEKVAEDAQLIARTLLRVGAVERLNQQQAAAQVLTNNLTLQRLMDASLRRGHTKDLATELLRDVEGHVVRRERGLRISEISDSYKSCLGHGLIQPVWMQSGGIGHLDVPKVMMESALDVGYRLIEKTKKKKSELTASELIQRLERNPLEVV